MELHGKSLLAGATAATNGASFRAVNPATGEALSPDYYEADMDDVDRAMQQAEAAFETYRAQAPEEKATFLNRIADEIEALGDTLIERADAETGLGEGRLTGERGRTTGQLRMFADVVSGGSWVDARIDSSDGDAPDLRRMLMPLGPVAVFGASNFPLAFSTAGGDTASALAAGCPVVYKAHPAHPGTSELVGRAIQLAIEKTAVPEGVFTMVHARSTDIGQALVRHPLAKAVGFTGSLRAGRAIYDAAADRPEPIPVYAEMGSVNPVFVLPDALAERGDAIAEELHGSVTMGAGQFCTNPGLVIGPEGEQTDRLLDGLARQMQADDPQTMLYDNLSDNFASGVDTLRSVEGVSVVGGDSGQEMTAGGDGARAAPVALQTDAQTFLNHRETLSQEVFGPSTLFIAADGGETLEEIARSLDGQLTATLHATADDLAQHQGLVAALERKVGRLIFNGYPTGVEVCAAMHHGGPYPATTDVRSTSVGTAAIERFARPICYQDFPLEALPVELHPDNPRDIWRLEDGEWNQ